MIRLPDTDKKVIITHSGGLDSSTAVILSVEKYGAENVISVGFDYGQKQRYELDCAKALCDEIGVKRHVLDLSILGEISKSVSANISGSDIDMPTIEDVLGDPQPVSYIPNRNMIMLSITAAFAEANNADYIFTGIQATDQYGYWDTTLRFADSMNAVLNQNRKHPVKLVAPFCELTKTEELKLLQELNKLHLTKYTLTCYNPNESGVSCGMCPSCAERIKAFSDIEYIDPIPYNIRINWIKNETA